jgi:preprotein translocase subunit SecD
MKLASAILAALVGASTAPAATPTGLRIYAIGDKSAPVLTGADIIRSSVTVGTSRGHPAVALKFTKTGGLKFHQLTLSLARLGARTHRVEYFAFAVNGKVYFRPALDYRKTPAGLSSAPLAIQLPTMATARKFAALIRGR